MKQDAAELAAAPGLGYAEPVSGTVESVGKAAFRKMAVNKLKYLRVGKWPNPGFSYRVVRPGYGNKLGGDRSTEFVFAADPAVIVAKGSSTLAIFDVGCGCRVGLQEREKRNSSGVPSLYQERP